MSTYWLKTGNTTGQSSRKKSALSACLMILTLSLMLAIPAKAMAQKYFVVNTAALHFKNADERRAFTPGVGVEYSPSARFGFHAGTLSDSFGFQARYAGINWATKSRQIGRVPMRFLLGATVIHKQFHKNSDPETKLIPLPVVEFGLTPRAVLNVSGSPQLDVAGFRNNAVLFFQFKWNTG